MAKGIYGYYWLPMLPDNCNGKEWFNPVIMVFPNLHQIMSWLTSWSKEKRAQNSTQFWVWHRSVSVWKALMLDGRKWSRRASWSVKPNDKSATCRCCVRGTYDNPPGWVQYPHIDLYVQRETGRLENRNQRCAFSPLHWSISITKQKVARLVHGTQIYSIMRCHPYASTYTWCRTTHKGYRSNIGTAGAGTEARHSRSLSSPM